MHLDSVLCNFDFPLQIFKGYLFSLFRYLCINVHGGADVAMPHDFLNNLQVRFIFAKTSAKGMPQIMCRKMSDIPWHSIFPSGVLLLLQIIGGINVLDGLVDGDRIMHIPVAVGKHKSRIAVNLHRCLAFSALLALFF